ncbi:MAG: dockerin type I repeat-containing protein [Myxococcota bacterium]|nr:dockerin type I repeat-containing protein [Myxococcota bacterium]
MRNKDSIKQALQQMLFIIPLGLMVGCGQETLSPAEIGTQHSEQSPIESVCKNPGDLNADGNVNVSDIIKMVERILQGGNLTTPGQCSYDINGDDTVDVHDIVALVQMIVDNDNEDTPAEDAHQEDIPTEQYPNGPPCEGECEPNPGGDDDDGEGEDDGDDDDDDDDDDDFDNFDPSTQEAIAALSREFDDFDLVANDLVVDKPERASERTLDSASETVNGYAHDQFSDINSVELFLNCDNSVLLNPNCHTQTLSTGSRDDYATFSQDLALPYRFGLNLLETKATTGIQTTMDKRALLAGNFHPSGSPINKAIVARIGEGAGGFGTIENIIYSILPAEENLIHNPVFSSEFTQCYSTYDDMSYHCLVIANPDPVYSPEMGMTFSASVNLVDLSLGEVNLDLDAQSTGQKIVASADLTEPHIKWRVEIVAYDESGTNVISALAYEQEVTATFLGGDLQLKPTLNNNIVSIDLVQNPTFTLTGFNFDLGSPYIENLLNIVGIDLNSLIEEELTSRIGQILETQLPAALESIFQDLEVPSYTTGMNISDQSFSFEANLAQIAIDDDGIRFDLSSQFSSNAGCTTDTEGSLYKTVDESALNTGNGIYVSAGQNMLNQILQQVWCSGSLAEQHIVLPANFMPGGNVVAYYLYTKAELPPVAVLEDGTLNLEMGDFKIMLFAQTLEGFETILEAYSFVNVPLVLDSTSTHLIAGMGTPSWTLDVSYPDDSIGEAQFLEAIFNYSVTQQLQALGEIVASIKIPQIDGYTFTANGTEFGDDYATLGGILSLDN